MPHPLEIRHHEHGQKDDHYRERDFPVTSVYSAILVERQDAKQVNTYKTSVCFPVDHIEKFMPCDAQ